LVHVERALFSSQKSTIVTSQSYTTTTTSHAIRLLLGELILLTELAELLLLPKLLLAILLLPAELLLLPVLLLLQQVLLCSEQRSLLDLLCLLEGHHCSLLLLEDVHLRNLLESLLGRILLRETLLGRVLSLGRKPLLGRILSLGRKSLLGRILALRGKTLLGRILSLRGRILGLRGETLLRGWILALRRDVPRWRLLGHTLLRRILLGNSLHGSSLHKGASTFQEIGKFDLTMSRVKRAWTSFHHQLLPLPFERRFANDYSKEYLHLTEQHVAGDGIEIVHLQQQLLVIEILGIHAELFIPHGVQSFLVDFSVTVFGVTLDAHFNKRIA